MMFGVTLGMMEGNIKIAANFISRQSMNIGFTGE